MDMTISQGLRRISKLKGKLSELTQRAAGAVTYRETDPPAFPFASTMEQMDAARAEMIKLETALRVTNAVTNVGFRNGKITLAEATCLLQETKGRIAWLKSLSVQSQAQKTVAEQAWDPIARQHVVAASVFRCDLPEAKRAEWVQKEQDTFDALNDAVESVNHTTQLRD